MTNSILAKAFDNVASGINTRYWMGLLIGFKGLTLAPNRDAEAHRGYRIGLRLRALGTEVY